MIRTALSIAALSVALGACATTPVAPPKPDAPPSWQAGAPAAEAPMDPYWQAFSADPALQALLAQAGDTPDAAIAAARVREAEALLRAARAALFPAITASGGATLNAAEGQSGFSATSATLGLAAPLDLFGGARAGAGAAAARKLAAEADLGFARLSARRSAGQLYAALRTAQASRAAAERQSRDAEESLSLARTRAAAGLESGLAVAQAQSAADAARARIPAFAQGETQARLGLEALLGLQPGALAAQLREAQSSAFVGAPLLDAPAAVLARRPDLRAAEARLIAAGLDARAARAAIWPTASIGALLTQSSASRGPDGAAASGGLTLAATLFDFGRLDALADAAGARAAAEAAAYERAVLFALSGVEREADRLTQAGREEDAARAAVASAREQASLARARYTSGLSSFLDVLLAERAVADAEIALASVQGRRTDAAIALAAELGLGQQP